MKTKIYFLRGENRFVRYVGKTSETLEYRLWCHLHEAKKGHKCKRCDGIRALFHKGLSPTIDLITEVEGNGNNAERAYIKWLRSKGVDLWNLTDGGDGQSKGFRHKKETCIRISRTMKGKPHTEEHNRKVSASRKGQLLSEETKRKMSASLKGRISPMQGKRHTEEAKRKMRETKLGMQTGKNNPFYGRKHSKESIQKMRESHRKNKL